VDSGCIQKRNEPFSTGRTRLLHHLYQNLSGFCRIAHFSQECDASAKSFHPALSTARESRGGRQKRLGHSDLTTTLAYLEGEKPRSDRSRKQVNGTFAVFA